MRTLVLTLAVCSALALPAHTLAQGRPTPTPTPTPAPAPAPTPETEPAPVTEPGTEPAPDPGTAPAPGTEAVPTTEPTPAPASVPTPPAAARRPKVAVITVGDPDEDLRGRARALEDVLASTDEVVLPGDPGLRAALRGEPPPEEDDGLGRVRRERRRLSGLETEDIAILASLGRLAGAVAVVAVHREGSRIEAAVLDVASARLFEGGLALENARADAITQFVASRGRTSARRAAQAGSTRPAAGQGAAAGGGANAQQNANADGEEEEEEEKSFLEKAWPYFVAGALLAGVLVYALAVDTTPDPGPPVLRFVPGGR